MFFMQRLGRKEADMPEAQLNKEFVEYPEKGEGTEKSGIKIPDSYVKNMTYADMITEFPRLVLGGQFANAMVVIQGHARFLWFYRLLEKVNLLLCSSKTHSQAAVKNRLESLHAETVKTA